MIHILTGPIRSGKTTTLLNWIKDKKDAAGILTPDVDGFRHFMNIATRQLFKMEASENEEKIVVGRFAFSKNNFNRANEILLNETFNDGWLIIDEIGPLELIGHGYNESIIFLLTKRYKKTLWVVREGLITTISKHFKIENSKYEVLTISNLCDLK